MKPKLLVLTSSFMRWKNDSSSGHVFVYELSKRLLDTFDVFVLAPCARKSKKEEEIDGLKIHRFNQFPLFNIELAKIGGILNNLKRNRFLYFVLPFFLIMQLISIARIVRIEKIDVIHAHWIIPQAFLAILYKKLSRANIKIIATIHGSDFWKLDSKFSRRIRKYVFNNIDELTVVSTFLRDAVIEFGYKKEVYVYPMGVDTATFSPDKKSLTIKERLKLSGECLLFVGACTENKGIRYLIKAIPSIVKVYPRVKLIIIGDGPLKVEMIKLARQLNVEESVIFLGAMLNNELPEYYATADYFILPSFSEGFPVALMEAMSSGCIPICSDIPIFNSVLDEGKTGFIIETQCFESISDKVISALKNIDTNSDIRSEIRSYAVKNYDWSDICGKYELLLSKVLKS